LAFIAALLLGASPARALDVQREDVAGFVGEVAARNGFDAEALRTLFAQVESRQAILDAMARPAEKTLTWQDYRARFITERRVHRGTDVYRAAAEALEKAAAGGVPAPVILGIVGIETFYGENTGRYRVIDALSTLAFDYPARSAFFRGELEQFLLMAREESLDPRAPLGSYAGAMGIPQFMPTSFRSFAIDGDGDGHRDLWGDWPDVFASVANYLAVHGWKSGEPVMVPADISGADLGGVDARTLALSQTVGSLRQRGVRFETALPPETPAMLVALGGAFGGEYRVGFANFYAITRYNRSALYASAVNDLAEAIAAARARELPPDDDATFAD
jgi:membrane-bound lytic murein transglycosylase B